MGLLEQAFVEQFIEFAPRDKRTRLEKQVVKLLGGSSDVIVTGLPSRRGSQDGGIDGRASVTLKTDPNSEHTKNDKPKYVEAAINVKIEKTRFSRNKLGAFINDMDRENLSWGLIVSAVGLSPDAANELKRHNEKGHLHIEHLLLADLLTGNDSACRYLFQNHDLSEKVRETLKAFLDGKNQQ